MKRRLLLARALLHEPLLVILDEPTAGVDIELRHDLWNYIRLLHEQGTTILLTTHYLEEAESLCEDIALISAGRIVARDTPEGLKQRFDATTPRGGLPADGLDLAAGRDGGRGGAEREHRRPDRRAPAPSGARLRRARPGALDACARPPRVPPRDPPVDADDPRPGRLLGALHPRLRPLARQPDQRDQRVRIRRLHRPRADRDGDGPGGVLEQLLEPAAGAQRPLHQRRPRLADAAVADEPRLHARRRLPLVRDRPVARRHRAAADRRADRASRRT